MLVAKTPTSSLTGASIRPSCHSICLLCCVDTTVAPQLFVNRLWYRTKAKIKSFFREGAPKVSTTRSSPITDLPKHIVGIILSHLTYDTPTLLACSLTCYSWYIAAVSHLHHSLTIDNERFVHWLRARKRHWPGTLKRLHDLGLLPLVKRLRVRLDHDHPFGPKQLRGRTMRYFSALANLQELEICHLQVSSFTPNIKRCFGHLSPTLRSLALQQPRGSCRQILYLVGLFPNLQDFKLEQDFIEDEQESAVDLTPTPLSTPPLRGWLTLTCCTKRMLLKEMIALFGGLRFRHMDIFGVTFVHTLLDACTETLETLRLYPTDPCGE